MKKTTSGHEISKTQGVRSFGKIPSTDPTLCDLYFAQLEFQGLIVGELTFDTLPADNKEWFVYHTAAMVEELGELLKADKRWKTHRNTRYQRDEKLDELADVFITAINLGIFSGFDATEITEAISRKIAQNTVRIKNRERESKDNGAF